MFIPHYQNTVWDHNVKTANKLFENAAEFTYLRIVVMNKNSVYEKTAGRLNSGNTCYKLLVFWYKNLKSEMSKCIIFSVLYGYEDQIVRVLATRC